MKAKWEELGIDAIIMPSYPIPAFKSQSAPDLGAFRDYQVLWSVLHYPAGVIPITTVGDGNDLIYPDDGYNDPWTKAI